MNRSILSVITLAAAALTATHTMADTTSAPKTRDQVKAELAEAIRTGHVVVNGETGQKANELFPGLYPAKPATQAKTREQVKAELQEAVRTGDVQANDDSGLKLNQLYPQLYKRNS